MLLWGCEKNEVLELNQLSVPSIEQSKKAFLSNKKLSKSTNSFVSKIAWDKSSEIIFKEDIKVLNTPLDIKSNKIKSFVTSIEKNGKVENQIVTLLFDDDANNNYFSGKLLIHNSEGAYVKGYKYEKGKKMGIYIFNEPAYKSKGNCTPEPLTLEEYIMLYQAGMIDGSETELFGCTVELADVQGMDDNSDEGGGDVDWQTPDNNLGDGNPSGGGTGFSWWNPTFNIFNNLTDPCAKNIFTELENGLYKEDPIKPEVIISNTDSLNFSQEVLKLFNDSDKTHLTIQNNNDIGDSNATTKGAIITLSDTYLSSASKLSIARTMIHETIHAYINALYNNVVEFSSYSFSQLIEEYAKDNGYTIGTNTFHHNFMGQYIDAMAYSLYEWDKLYGSGKFNYSATKPDDLLGWEYYRAMAFGGMFQTDTNGNITAETDSFKAIEPDSIKREEIAKIVYNELKSNNDAKGTKCSD
ncbi:hypothetical protein [Polaribacter gochangensis]|uniref:hypothetical protein n=1 Tax=Polaribacter gochangensis TaxID=3252903 RepID=UPI0039049997